jgi:hypothetical protein
LRRGIRNWGFDTVGASCVGDSSRYGSSSYLAAHQSPLCIPNGTNIYSEAIRLYYQDKPYRDGDTNTCRGQDGKLNLITTVDDANDNGVTNTGEAKKNCTATQMDGDKMRLISECGGVVLCNYNGALTANDIESDGNIELPLVTDPALLTTSMDQNREYTIEQVLKHVITHELGHSIGAGHNTMGTCVMYDTTTDWKRDNSFSSTAQSQIKIHNDNLYDEP